MLMLSFAVNGDLRSRSNSAPVTHWLKEFYEESNIPSHGLRRRVSWIKVNTVGFRRLLGSNGTSIWRSGYLLWKLSPQAANTKMLPLTASLELSIVVSTDPGKLHSLICACKGSVFSPSALIASSILSCWVCICWNVLHADRLSCSEPLFMLPFTSTVQRRPSGLKIVVWNLLWTCLSLYFGVSNLSFKVEVSSSFSVWERGWAHQHSVLPFPSPPSSLHLQTNKE